MIYDAYRVINMMEEPHSKKIPTPPSSRPSSLRRPRTRYVSKILNQSGNQAPVFYQESTTEANVEEINLQKYKILPAIASCSDLRNERAKINDKRSERQGDLGNRPKNNSKRPFHRDSRSGNNSEEPINRDSRSRNNSERPVIRDNKTRNKSAGSHEKSDLGKLRRDVLDHECNQISTNLEDISSRPASECGVDEKQLEIAIRLPDGSRHEVCSSGSGTFMDLLQNLASSCVSDTIIPRNCEIVTSEVPQQVISDFNVTLRQAKIKTRTLLYLREVDSD